MNKHFVPTTKDAVLTHAIEEAAELIHILCKIKRFGFQAMHPETKQFNHDAFQDEWNDLTAAVHKVFKFELTDEGMTREQSYSEPVLAMQPVAVDSEPMTDWNEHNTIRIPIADFVRMQQHLGAYMEVAPSPKHVSYLHEQHNDLTERLEKMTKMCEERGDIIDALSGNVKEKPKPSGWSPSELSPESIAESFRAWKPLS